MRLTAEEISFLRFHVEEPGPSAWQFVPVPDGETVFQAMKVKADGSKTYARLPATSFARMQHYFDDNYQITELGRALVRGEVVQ